MKVSAPGQMAVAELAGILSEEAVRPRPREELHRHRVDLAGLHAGPYIGVRDAVAVHIGGKGMAGLMGHDLHIVLGAVEVGKDEGHLIIAQTGAVATTRLAGVDSTSISSSSSILLKNSPVSGGKAPHRNFFALPQDRIGIARRLGVAAAEHQGVVGGVHRVLLAQAPGLLAVDAVGHGDEVFHHSSAEFFPTSALV